MKTWMPIVGALIIGSCIVTFCTLQSHGQTTPIPPDVQSISAVDIAKTIAHKQALETELNLTLAAEAVTLRAAVEAATLAQVSLGVYEKKVEDLAVENATNYSAKLNGEKIIAQLHTKILRLEVVIGAFVLAIGAYLFAKFYLHLPL